MKRISPSTVTVGVFAVLFGLVAAYVARHYFDAPKTEAPAKQMATVIQAKVNLPKFSRIRDQDLEIKQVPVEQLPEGAVQMKSLALLRLVKGTIMAGQPILEADLYGVGEVPLLADQLPPGYRAVTLQVDANSALNGMIQPDSHVDVMLTVKDNQPGLGGMATLTLLHRIRVLATSETRFPRSEDRAGNLRNITVAVSPKQANKLILAQRYGTLSVTLRSSMETVSDEMMADAKDMVNPNDLLGLVLQPIPEPVEKKAQIWRGGSMREITFHADEVHESLRSTCKTCKKKGSPAGPTAATPAGTKTQEPTAAAPSGVPTADSRQAQPTLAAGLPSNRQPRGEVIYVQVEAELSAIENAVAGN